MLSLVSIALVWAVGYTLYLVGRSVYRLYFHPLSKFPGPKLAAVTDLRRAYIEVIARKSVIADYEQQHKKYGNIIRSGPNELHFANPDVYHEIYNSNNRWDKEESLYHSFGEDRSSFGYLQYADAKPRKDILLRIFSKKAIREAEHLVQEKVLGLCDSFVRAPGNIVDLYWAFHCMSIDVITYICFGNSVDALQVPGHTAPIILAMDASKTVFQRFKHSNLYKNMIMGCPPNIAKVMSPETAGLINLQQALRNQVNELSSNPESLKHLPHSTTIWNELLKPELHPGGKIPDTGSLFEESQALMFGGADTTGQTLMHGTFDILKNPAIYKNLKAELKEAWPDIHDNPSQAKLEGLPYLSAVIKEALRITPGVVASLPRIVPPAGAMLDGKFIPGGSCVGMSVQWVHKSPKIFDDPETFDPERWLKPNSRELDRWLVPFSKGPRSCVGLNLAWAELYLGFAHVFRKFEITIDPSSPKELVWMDNFLPEYIGPHLKAKMVPLKE